MQEIDTNLSMLATSTPSPTLSNSTPSIIPSYIHNTSLPASSRSGLSLHDTTIMLLAAGFETTGFTLTIATYHLLSPSSNPHLQKLLHELHTAIPNPASIPPWHELEKLPYLSAVVQESLRLSLGASARLPRRNSKEDMWYKGWKIPRGTVVGMTHADLHHDPTIFPDPKRFDPGRWLQVEGSASRDRYLVPFSRGSRRCMGIQYVLSTFVSPSHADGLRRSAELTYY